MLATGPAAGEGPAVDDSMPPDDPPRIEAPGPYRRPAWVELDATFIARLRESYGRDRRIGRRPEVKAWIEGLKAGKVRPREQAS